MSRHGRSVWRENDEEKSMRERGDRNRDPLVIRQDVEISIL